MKYRIFIISLFIISCSGEPEKEKEKAQNNSAGDSIARTNTKEETAPIRRYAEGLEDFSNIEWIEYCLPLPVYEYEEGSAEEVVKGQHRFINKKDKESFVMVRGLERDDKSVSLEKYFENSYPVDDEAAGKIILTKAIKANINAFYATGYWSNYIHEYRFLEITWLRKDDVVVLKAFYPIADTTKWNGYLVSLLTVNSECQ
jgi:hypothetical protein